MSNPEIFRPRSNYLYAAGAVIFCSGMLLTALIYGNVGSAIDSLCWGALISYSAYLLFIRPKVTVFDEGISITNPLHSYTIGWGEIQAIEAKYTMFVIVGEKRIYAWAAPAPGRYHARTIHETEIKGLSIANSQNMRPGESPRTHSGVATHLARLRYDAFRRGGLEGVKSESIFERSSFIVLIALTTMALLTWFF